MNNKKIIEKMTLEEKASLLSGRDFWTTESIERLNVPSIFLADGPHGVRKQAAASDHLGLNESIKATCFPTSATMANTWNVDLIEKLGNALGSEAVDQDVNILLGPGTNIKRSPLCGRNFEYFSEDPFLSGKMSSAHIKGVQSNGISACVKHYAANNQEERRLVIDTILDERTLREIYLTPFEHSVKEANVRTVMSSYNKVNGVYANENNHLLKDILRDEWDFDGIIVTDWGGNNDRVKALEASNELEMPGNKGETDLDIINAVKSNVISEDIVDEAVDRLLNVIYKTNETLENKTKEVNYDENHEVAYETAKEAIVLLENKNNFLPLNSEQKIAVIGDFAKEPRYQGAGSSIVNPTKVDDTLSFIDEYSNNFVGFERGFKRYGKKSSRLIKKAVKLANKSDVVLLYLGLDEISEAEGIDRKNIKLPKNQLDLLNSLIETNKKIVVVLSAGSVVEIDFNDKVDGLLHGYLLGQAGSKAILDVLYGKVNPSGKLSETIPLSYEDVSSSNYFPGKEVSVEYREGIYVGYRYFDKVNKKVKYPFGYGLSYTSFEYSDLVVTEKGATFNITNTGDVLGKEVAQLYVGLEDSKIFRAKKELKGFAKVELKPNETKEVFIPFDEYTFRYFNIITNKFEIEEGSYTIYINSSVETNLLKDNINKKGTTNKLPYQDSEKLKSYFKGNIEDVSLEEFEELLGFKAPNPNRNYYKKNRIVVDYNTTVYELRYAKGWTGRFFSRMIRFAPKFLRFFGKKELANTIIMGMYHQPMRGLSRMSNGMVSWGQLDGLITMFNGKFFKGFKKYLKEGKIKKRRLKNEEKK